MRNLVVCFALSLALGCRSPKVSGAVYADQIPVYPGASLVSTSQGSYTDSAGKPPSLVTQNWFFKTRDSIQKVADFYQRKLPQAKRDDSEDATTFTILPQGAEPGENASVTLRPGEVQIGETTKPGKRKP